MALDDNAVVLPGTGYIFTHEEPGKTFPFRTQAELDSLVLTDPTVGDGWVNLGHTSRENAVAFGREAEGGEVKGSWQKANLRKSGATVTWSIGIAALQVSNDVLTLYFGGGDTSDPDAFHTPFVGTPIERALGIVLVDGTSRFGWGIAKVALEADEAPEFDPENFLEFSLTGTVLEHTGADGLMSLYRKGLGTPA